jgi:ATP-dependent Clp protease ATP-binding subunit ClpB
MSDATTNTIPPSDFLVRGSEYLKKNPGFKLIGRDKDLENVANVLMRKENNNLVLHGQNGVGLSSILLGMQAAKEDVNTPFDIVGKRFYFLDIDALFSSGDANKINEGFQQVMTTLKSQPDTVLVIEDTKDFLDGVRNNGVNNIVNTLMREARLNAGLQVVFETRDANIGDLFKAHSDIGEDFTFLQVNEPSPAAMKDILEAAVPGLEEFHGVKITADAVKTVLELTAKYPGLSLNTAQPKRSTMIMEGALTAYRHKMHSNPLSISRAEAELEEVHQAQAGRGPLTDKSPAELEALLIERQTNLETARSEWKSLQDQIRAAYNEQRTGEDALRRLDREIEEQRQKDQAAAEKAENAEVAGNAEAGEGVAAEVGKPRMTRQMFGQMARAGIQTEAVSTIQSQRDEMARKLEEAKAKYKAMAASINEGLELRGEHVLAEFSRLSGVPMNKLQQDETAKLMGLEDTMKGRVFGQDEPVEELAKAVRRGRAGLKKPNKPIGSFLFLGPSGVGKTELAKALAEAIFGDESSLQVYDMSEYMEKHAAAKLIGSPPGYEGYEAGGILTNNMRRKPYCVNVFDEVEKANKTVFDLFLQVLDEGRLTDNHGIPASFANSINIFTSNVGAQYFLDENLEFDAAKELALKDLWNPEKDEHGNSKGFRPEFLNRFSGIFCFNRLGQPQIIKIAQKTMRELNSWVAENGLTVEMSDADLQAMCQDKYVPKNGARGIMNYIEREITSDVADTVLQFPDTPGTVQVAYDAEKKGASMTFVPAAKAAGGPANQNSKTAAGPKPAQA